MTQTRKNRVRLDALLTAKGLAQSRSQAKQMIMAGEVLVNGQPASKPGNLVNENDVVELKGTATQRYVSRGGIKLEWALQQFSVHVTDATALDVGASTGGFTQCLLLHGARKVYAVDVGYGQLAWNLRNDPRVIVLERTNARYLSRELIPDPIQIATLDVSFISLKLIIPAVKELLADQSHVLALVKPQFEAGRDKVGKKGVVRDAAVHEFVILQVAEHASSQGLNAVGVTYSPIRGPEGNIEFWLHLRPQVKPITDLQETVIQTVRCAHEALSR